MVLMNNKKHLVAFVDISGLKIILRILLNDEEN